MSDVTGRVFAVMCDNRECGSVHCSAAGRHCSIVPVLRGIDCSLNTAHSAACMQPCSQAQAAYEKILRKSKISFFGTCKIFIYVASSSQQINILPWDLGGEWPVLATWPRRHPWDGLVRDQAVPGTAPGPAQPIRSRLCELWTNERPCLSRVLPDLTAGLIICVADPERETRPALGPGLWCD